jgi:hypothetical protein
MATRTTEQAEAREELRRRTEGAAALSFGEALDYLDSEDAAGLIEAAGLAHLGSRALLEELTGFRV